MLMREFCLFLLHSLYFCFCFPVPGGLRETQGGAASWLTGSYRCYRHGTAAFGVQWRGLWTNASCNSSPCQRINSICFLRYCACDLCIVHCVL
ncbi:hypothetical protein HDV63DRAFT_329096 [Trichoderma sp. SZMC 28014]